MTSLIVSRFFSLGRYCRSMGRQSFSSSVNSSGPAANQETNQLMRSFTETSEAGGRTVTRPKKTAKKHFTRLLQLDIFFGFDRGKVYHLSVLNFLAFCSVTQLPPLMKL